MNNKAIKIQEDELLLECARELHTRIIAEDSLYEFAKQAWKYVEGDIQFSDGWHIQVICEHLEAVTKRQIRNLLINIPPRCMKSGLVSVMWPAWVWLNNPQEQFLYASYSNSLSMRDSVKCRRLILSNWYQTRWEDRYTLVGDQNTKHRFDNNKIGYRIAASVGSSVTGEGASCLILDDPNNAKDGESDIKRQSTNDWYSQVWSTRLNNPKTGCRIIVQQRLHQQDISGNILSNDISNEWIKLILPMEFETARRSKTIILPSTNGKVWEDPRKKEGELLWPNHIGLEEVKKLKNGLRTPYRIAGQLQQRPAPEEGGIIKKSWFKWWKKPRPPKIEQVIQSWDTALGDKEENNYSACTTWGLFIDDNKIANIILLGLWRGRVSYPDLRKMAKRLYNDYRDDGATDIKPDSQHIPDMVLVESKASGISLIQDLRRAGISATQFDPTRYGDKKQRVHLVTHIIQAGRVWVPAIPPDYKALRRYSELFVNSCAIFPSEDSRDLVDTMTQVLTRLRDSYQLIHPDDPLDDDDYFDKKQIY